MKNGIIAYGNPTPEQAMNILLADEDGSVVKQLTDGPSRDWFPAWSPDGAQIAYTSDRGSTHKYYGVDAEDYSLVDLPNREAARDYPGRGLHPMPNGIAQVWIMDADGANQRPLTSEGRNAHPAWSPDGTQIAFNSTRTGQTELFMMNADGSNQRQLTHSAPEDPGPWEHLRRIELLMHGLYAPEIKPPVNVFPTWRPDGQRIAFCRISRDDYSIWAMDPDGGNQQRLTFDDDPAFPQANCPSWSPKGDQIAFWSGTNVGPGWIWVMDADGANRRRISDHGPEATADEPAWSADGARVIYTTSRRDERNGLVSAVWICDPDGANQRPLMKETIPGFNRVSWKPGR